MTKASRWAWIISVVAALGAGLVLTFLLSVATTDPALYERHYVWLFWVNVTVAALLVVVIVIAGVRLLLRVRRGKFGSRLLLKLTAIFALVGVVPGVLIYTVSFQFVSRSIESWFDLKVERALDAGLNLGRGTLDAMVSDLATKTRLAAERLGDTPGNAQPLALERLREQLSAQEVAIVGSTGQILLATGGSASSLLPERPVASLMRLARSARVASQLEGLDEDSAAAPGKARVRALALIVSSTISLGELERYLLVTQPLPPAVAANALAVELAYREYQQRALARDGLRRMYIGTLTLTLVLAVFAAVLLAVALGNQLARPLLLLAEGVRQVARGDLSAKPVFASNDELGGLTRSFAVMTEQLAEARNLVQRSVMQVEGARTNLQTILDNLTAGVIVLDAQGRIQSSNPGATRVLRVPLAAHAGQLLADVPGLQEFAVSVQNEFDDYLGERQHHGLDHWQQAFELGHDTLGTNSNTINLVARGAELPGTTRLLVFDDISEIVSAQRAQAWGEVARRLAHEIKNPLTPIQLSAERLQMKLTGKLPPEQEALLNKSVRTIVDQVDAMKRLVNEFRDFGRLPAAQLHAVDLNALVIDVLALYGGEERADRSSIMLELDPACPPIVGDAQQLRQVIHNLLQNAQDAVEQDHACSSGTSQIVTVRTQWNPTSRRVRLAVRDNGPGFPDFILKRAFEPYVTTKAKGTGLGLAVVKKIADEHGARIDLGNRVVDGVTLGAQVSLSFAVAT